MTMHPPRSLLYVPASNGRALAKAASLDADAIIVDLEDSVAPEAKDAAREAMVEAVRAGFGKKPVVVRINAIDSPWCDKDLAAVFRACPAAVLWPKLINADAVEEVTRRSKPVPVWVMIETPHAIISASRMARVPGVDAFVLGLNDLAAALRATVGADRAELMPHIAHTLLAARAGDIAAYDGVPSALTDLDAVAAESAQAARMGFDGKTLVHPAQITPVNAAFTPDADAQARAHAILVAWDTRAPGVGVTVHDGRLIEAMHADAARRTLARAGVGD